jgi:hypothetical protein
MRQVLIVHCHYQTGQLNGLKISLCRCSSAGDIFFAATCATLPRSPGRFSIFPDFFGNRVDASAASAAISGGCGCGGMFVILAYLVSFAIAADDGVPCLRRSGSAQRVRQCGNPDRLSQYADGPGGRSEPAYGLGARLVDIALTDACGGTAASFLATAVDVYRPRQAYGGCRAPVLMNQYLRPVVLLSNGSAADGG